MRKGNVVLMVCAAALLSGCGEPKPSTPATGLPPSAKQMMDEQARRGNGGAGTRPMSPFPGPR